MRQIKSERNLLKSKVNLSLKSSKGIDISIVGTADLENLRAWKNSQKEFFFHQQDISVDQQFNWYKCFLERPLDFLFVTRFKGIPFGCLGVRWLENHWDVYNVILGDTSFGKKGLMSDSFQAILSYIFTVNQSPVKLKVLKMNPAVRWYERHGFRIIEERVDCYIMALINN